MPTPALLLARLGFVGLGKETTQGTAVAATIFLPVQSIKPEDIPQMVDDDSIVASAGKIRGSYQGERDAAFEFGGLLFPDSVGSLLTAAGLADSTTATAGTKVGTVAALAAGATTATYTVTSGTAPITGDVIQFDVAPNAECRSLTSVTGTGPYTLNWAATAPLLYAHASGAAANNVTGNFTHAFKLPSAGTQPPSWTITHYNVAATRQYPGMVMDTLDITIDAKGVMKHVSKFKGWPSSTTTKPVATFPSTAAYLGWEAALTLAGSSNNKMVSGAVAIKRTTDSQHTLQGSQNPYNVFADAIEASLKAKLLFLDETDWNHLNTNDQPATVLTITPPSAGPVLTITSTVGAWKKAPVDSTSKMMQVGDVDITCVTNSTDVGPLQASLVNTVANGY